ncbi:ArsR family transcriptional regulator [Streptococcus halitosis]|uniref:ArsR family transcriptional regulator n=1 Tax=Streptococcus halitosis TaxID=2172545 RepID=A0A3R8LU53_9STRE|nr:MULTISPECIES: RhuM family protein [Streptococcus]NIB85528.1 ArsR family transcriptional regulator [Streptococcus sp. CCUG 71758]RRN46236.1 ArsR family transcriptional regulator [Streptococcus halitosis]
MNEISNFVLYTTPNGDVNLDILLQDENLWLTQKEISDLFGVSKSTVSHHLSNIYSDGELDKLATVRKFRTVQKEGSRAVQRELEYYNLDSIISVGYRVNSTKATQFRIWATNTLKEFIIKGFVLDDERLKQGQTVFGKDYFRELLERIRSIRASERRIYQQITDIFAECAIDYDRNSEITKNFYAMVQNKFHFAITGNTAAEIIYHKADADKKQMGLTTWKNAPDGRVLKSDVTVAKNYLQETEIRQLERTVTSYFDYIEGLVERRNTFTMQSLAESIDRFLSFNEYEILEGKGSISKKQADEKASQEYEKFNRTQKIVSDFDKQIKKLMAGDKDE